MQVKGELKGWQNEKLDVESENGFVCALNSTHRYLSQGKWQTVNEK